MQKYIFILLLVLFPLGGCATKNISVSDGSPLAVVNKKKINLLLAKTNIEHVNGLSRRKSLAENTGMLFVFGDRQPRAFWMKEMNFPLDIIWINKDEVVGVSQNAPPEGATPKHIYKSPLPVDFVLEVNAGFCDKNGIKTGDKVYFFNID